MVCAFMGSHLLPMDPEPLVGIEPTSFHDNFNTSLVRERLSGFAWLPLASTVPSPRCFWPVRRRPGAVARGASVTMTPAPSADEVELGMRAADFARATAPTALSTGTGKDDESNADQLGRRRLLLQDDQSE